jgi:hypothetical protein
MARQVIVSSAQKSAAQAMVNRSLITGRTVSRSVHKIANAEVVVRSNRRSVKSSEPAGSTSPAPES